MAYLSYCIQCNVIIMIIVIITMIIIITIIIIAVIIEFSDNSAATPIFFFQCTQFVSGIVFASCHVYFN